MKLGREDGMPIDVQWIGHIGEADGEFDFHPRRGAPRRHSSIRQLAGMVEVLHQIIEVRRL